MVEIDEKYNYLNLPLPGAILNTIHYVVGKASQEFTREGIVLEKGAVLSERRIEKNMTLYQQYISLWTVYPDLYLKLITPTTSKFRLKFFQIIFLRACLRYGRVLTIAPRAAGKSFICILALYLICMFRPGSHVFQCAPGKAQGAKIANQKIHQLWDLLPLLKEEILGEGNFGNDYVKLSFRNGSILDVISPLNSARGNRATVGILDEFRDHDANNVNEIILPFLNIERPMVNQDKNEYEPQQVQLWISSASDKNTFAYDKTIELMELAILQPEKVFCWGFDYRVPVYTGLLSKDFLNEMQMSSTFSEQGFAKEYMSRFVGSSDDAWFDYEKLLTHRRIVNPETHEIVRSDIESFYILSVDVARKGCQTACTVLKVYPGGEKYTCNVVNVYVLGKTEDEKVFDRQVIELKRLIKRFNPREVVLDINGIGVGFADFMIKESLDPVTGEVLPAYGFIPDHDFGYEDIQPRNCPKIIYGIKATGQINSDMHTALYAKVYSGCVNFLISERKARDKINATEVGKKMTPEQKIARLMPHEMTSQLIDEIVNLRTKPTGINNQIKVELINQRMTKDKFSALEMGIYRMVEIENEEISHRRNRGLGRKLTFFKSGGRKR